MYISKLFFKGELFAWRTKAMPRVTGNYSENEQNQIARFVSCCLHSLVWKRRATQLQNEVTERSTLLVYHCFFRLWNAAHALGTAARAIYFQLFIPANIYFYTQSVLKTKSVRNFFMKTTMNMFQQKARATVEQNIVELLWSTLGLFICLSPTV